MLNDEEQLGKLIRKADKKKGGVEDELLSYYKKKLHLLKKRHEEGYLDDHGYRPLVKKQKKEANKDLVRCGLSI